ncbi:MAG: HYR domain-containing protein [Verrucomicrobia bacterium]|nr:HYR domain-containing protein [Verrucomicrobiota bacterium]
MKTHALGETPRWGRARRLVPFLAWGGLLGLLSGAWAAPVATPRLEGWQNLTGGWGPVVQAANARYGEDRVVPVRWVGSLKAGSSHTLVLKYDFNRGGRGVFIDALASPDATEKAVDLTRGLDVATPPLAWAIPVDVTLPPDIPRPGSLQTWNVQALEWGGYGGTDGVRTLALRFTVAGSRGNATVVIAWGAHLASERVWGPGNGALQYPGASRKAYASLNGGADLNVAINPDALQATADLALNLSGPAQARVGDEVLYTIEVANAGPNVAVDTRVTDVLPVGTTRVGVAASDGTLLATDPVVVSLGDLAPGAGATLTITALVGEGAVGEAQNTAWVSSATTDPVLANNSASVITRVEDVDRQPPALLCPGDREQDADPELCGARVDFEVSAVDEESAVTLVVTPGSGSLFPIGTTVVTATATDASGNVSECTFHVTVRDEANESWPGARRLTLTDHPDLPGPRSAFARQCLTRFDQSRWYRFRVEPGSTLVVTLTELAANYDLVVFKDVAETYARLLAEPDPGWLSAAFAPDAFSPAAFSADALSPAAFSPAAFSPAAFSPAAFSPAAFSPAAFSPAAFSPAAFSPDAYAPAAFSPAAFSPAAFSPAAFSPAAFSPDMFAPAAFSDAQAQSVIGVSAFDGTAGEGVIVRTWDSTGEFYVRVRGRNGVFQRGAPFRLDVYLYPGTCGALALEPVDAQGVPLPPAANVVAGDYRTLILTDPARMRDDGHLGSMAERLQALAARPEVRGVIVDLGLDPRVAFFQAQADGKLDCPTAKNLVAAEIKRVVDDWRAANPALEHIVLVGGDAVIPFFRYPRPGVARAGTELRATRPGCLRLAGQPAPELRPGAGRLWGPLRAAPRRVPPAASRPGRGASGRRTGRSRRHDRGVSRHGGRRSRCAFRRAGDRVRFPGRRRRSRARRTGGGSGTAGGHADHARGQGPGRGLDGGPVARRAVHFAARPGLPGGALQRVRGAGRRLPHACRRDGIAHGGGGFPAHDPRECGLPLGYNAVDGDGIAFVTPEPDWAQACARRQITLLAGTGYQYGDTEFIEYSERLYLEFFRELRRGTGPVPVGRALLRAKERYLATTPTLRGLHEKAFLQASLFGLPMLAIGFPAQRLEAGADLEAPVVAGAAIYETPPGSVLGLARADIEVIPTFSPPRQLELTDFEGGGRVTATYFEGRDGLLSNPAEPVLPLEVRNVTLSDTVLRGVGFRGAAYEDLEDILPLTGAATTEIRGVHIGFPSEVFFPVQPWTVNYFPALCAAEGGITRLAIAAAQFRAGSASAVTGTLRRFQHLNFRLFYSDNLNTYPADGISTPGRSGPPSLSGVFGRIDGDTVHFSARAVGNPSAGVQEVWVTYTATQGPRAGRWQSLDLTQSDEDSTLWVGQLPLGGEVAPQDIRYVVQAVSGVGLVALHTRQGRYHIPGFLDGWDDASAAPTVVALENPPATAVFGARLTLTARLTANDVPLEGLGLLFQIADQQAFARTGTGAAAGIATVIMDLATVPGQHEIKVTYPGGFGLAPSWVAAPLTLLPATTRIEFAPPDPVVGAANPEYVTATLRNGSGFPIPERTLLFVVEGGGVVLVRPVITDYAGRATLGESRARHGHLRGHGSLRHAGR